jgi:hypothetical protein
MTRSWPASMRTSLVATLGRPDWWVLALAGFLIRGGFVVVMLPLFTLPTVAQLSTLLAPTVETLVIGGATPVGAVLGGLVLAAAIVALAIFGLAGAWFDQELTREVAADDDVELGWRPTTLSVTQAFRIRLTAHLPTALALVYATARVVALTYDELLSPGDPTISVVARVLDRAPDVVAVVVLTWLAGETVGALAVRRVAAGATPRQALWRSVRQLLSLRGLATLGATSAAVLVVGLPFLLALGRAWEHLRTYVLDQVDAVPLAAALVLLVGTWILGLSILGAALAWRASAWTVEAALD